MVSLTAEELLLAMARVAVPAFGRCYSVSARSISFNYAAAPTVLHRRHTQFRAQFRAQFRVQFRAHFRARSRVHFRAQLQRRARRRARRRAQRQPPLLDQTAGRVWTGTLAFDRAARTGRRGLV